MRAAVWDRSNSAARSRGKTCGKLEGKAWRRRKARERPGIGVEMWQPTRLAIDLDEKSGLSLAGTAFAAGGNNGAKPTALLQLGKEGIRHLGHAAIQQNHIERPGFGRAAGERAFDDRPVGNAKLLQGFPGSSCKLRLSLTAVTELARCAGAAVE